MKKLLLIMVVVLLTLSVNSQRVSTNCTQLFFSELTFGKNYKADSLFDLNYAVEIFNPTEDSINLTNYTLELTDSADIQITIPLGSESIAPGDVYVICDSAGELSMLSIADKVIPHLDFEHNIYLDLRYNDYSIDRIGETTNDSSEIFDRNALIADPIGYLSSININLNDYQEIDIRRSMFTSHGDTNFVTANQIGKWGYFPNADKTNLGQHSSVCNLAPTDPPIGGFLYSSKTINEVGGTTTDDLNLQFSPSSPSSFYTVTHAVLSGPAQWDLSHDIYFTADPSATSGMTCSSALSTTNCSFAWATGYSFPGQKSTVIDLQSPDFTVDWASNTHTILINGGQPAGLSNSQKNLFSVQPTITSTVLNITSKENGEYTIWNLQGEKVLSGLVLNNTSIDVSSLRSSTYCILLNYGTDGIEKVKFVKN